MRYTITVPLNLNDGTETPLWYLNKVQREILSVFGGTTFTDSHGLWVNEDGKVFNDKVRVYTLYTDKTTYNESSHFAQLCVIAKAVCATLDQECVFVTDEHDMPHFITR